MTIPAHRPQTPDGFDWPPGFLFGASTSPHQVEGNNVSSDWWVREHSGNPGPIPITEPSGDAVDHFHRWPEDMDLLRDLGFNAYRFGIEWARIEPEPGNISRAMLEHYRGMIRGAVERGLTPVVTLHHFTSPHWFAARGGWLAPDAADVFANYAAVVAEILGEGVEYVATINEPNMITLVNGLMAPDGDTPDVPTMAALVPHQPSTDALIRAHKAAVKAVKAVHPHLKLGWTIASQVFQAEPGAEAEAAAYAWPREKVFLDVSRDDDWVGVQSYSRTRLGKDGPIPHAEDTPRTLVGLEYYPPALGEAVRQTAAVVGPDVAILVTENGIAADDDTQRIAYTTGALEGLAAASADGIDVRAYLHWSALDNYEWGSYHFTFGLIHVDRASFARTPKPSAYWLGGIARELNS
ncbi:family 1 glycosylhydrolase [Uniformispora flossi]|uniref:family 1 glycosylhydrolase n=1 Tax=Uniformispora flossi TaxID=3390723 RepID=UPI003C2F3435